MKKVTKVKTYTVFAAFLMACILITGFTKPVIKPTEKKVKYEYVKVPDWENEKNPKKIEYLEHLYNTSE